MSPLRVLSFSRFAVFEKGGSGLYRPPDLYHSLPVLPARGRPVFQLLPVSQTGIHIPLPELSDVYENMKS